MSNDEEKEEELLLLKLEEEVESLAQKTAHYRATLSSTLTTKTPILQPQPASDGPTYAIVGSAETETTTLAITEEPEELKKIQLLKDKIASNASTALVVLERMKEVMVKIDKLGTSNVDIHPAFKRKRTN